MRRENCVNGSVQRSYRARQTDRKIHERKKERKKKFMGDRKVNGIKKKIKKGGKMKKNL